MKNFIKDYAVVTGYVFLLVGWLIFAIEEFNHNHTFIPAIPFTVSIILFIYDLIKNKL